MWVFFWSLHKCTALTFWPNLGSGIAKEVVPQIVVKFDALMVYFHTQGACHNVALPFTLKSILRKKKKYGKFKYFTMQK
jgi:hypothetical protein